jgi:hypothetical protein
MTERRNLPVLFITGMGRSGSTLIANILGQADGYVATGELQHIWERSFLNNNPCGCGMPFLSCPFWQPVVEGGFAEIDAGQISRWSVLHRQQTRTLRMYALHRPEREFENSPARQEYTAALRILYHAIFEISGARCLVDSSKNPLYAAILDSVPGIDLYLVHLIRDLRGVAYSRFVRKDRRGETPKTPGHFLRLLESSILWSSWNAGAEALGKRRPGRYIRIRYEDFLAAPQRTLSVILERFRFPETQFPFVSSTMVELRTNHFMSGNVNRFTSGTVEIVPDNRWKTGLSPLASRFLLASSKPWMARYGYLDR